MLMQALGTQHLPAQVSMACSKGSIAEMLDLSLATVERRAKKNQCLSSADGERLLGLVRLLGKPTPGANFSIMQRARRQWRDARKMDCPIQQYSSTGENPQS